MIVLAPIPIASEKHGRSSPGDHGGQFVLIKADDIVGIFPDRSLVLEAGHHRFGIDRFIVREITDSEPVLDRHNVVP